MKYQLVIQFPEELNDDLDWIADIEDQLDEQLINAEVDGHDMGSGEINIFILTNEPIQTCEIAKNLFKKEKAVFNDIKIAYRKINTDKYICLWPQVLSEFNVI